MTRELSIQDSKNFLKVVYKTAYKLLEEGVGFTDDFVEFLKERKRRLDEMVNMYEKVASGETTVLPEVFTSLFCLAYLYATESKLIEEFLVYNEELKTSLPEEEVEVV